MAGYPYTGGIYGGYSDPENNKKKPFAGPKIDAAVSDAGNALASGVSQAYGKYRSGVDDTLKKTSDAYDKGGLGAAAGQYVRGTIGDVGNALVQGVGKPLMAGVVKPVNSLAAGVGQFGKTLVTGDASPIGGDNQGGQVSPATMGGGRLPQYATNASFSNPLASGVLSSRAMRQGKQLVIPSNQTTSVDGTGVVSEPNGQRTYTMGTPGQDGYGRVSVRPGNDVGQSARSALSTMPGQRTAQVGNGLTVTGSQDAINRLSAPVGKVDYSSPIYQRYEAENRAKEAYVNREPSSPLASNVPQAPKYMSKDEGIAQGLGWKARLAKYQADLDSYNKATGNQNALDVEAMREAGAGRRALLQAQGVNDQNAIARQRLGGELALNQANINAKEVEQQKGQMEIDQARKIQTLNDQYLAEKDPVKQKALGNQILTMNGKNTKDWQIATREETDPTTGAVSKRQFAVNLNDPSQVVEVGAGQSQSSQGAPKEAIEYLKKNPGQAQYFKQKYGYLPEGF